MNWPEKRAELLNRIASGDPTNAEIERVLIEAEFVGYVRGWEARNERDEQDGRGMKLIEIPDGTATRLLESVLRAGGTNESICQALREAYAAGYRNLAAHVLAEGQAVPSVTASALPPVVADRDGDEWTLNDDGTYSMGAVALTPAQVEEEWGPLTLPGAPFTFGTAAGS